MSEGVQSDVAPTTLPPGVPDEAGPFLQAMGYWEADRIHVGDPVPALALTSLDGAETVTLGAGADGRPVVLIFGSYT